MFCDRYLSTKLLSFNKSEQMSKSHFHQLHFSNSSPKNTLTCWNFIVKKKKCFWGSLHIYKSSSNCENCLSWSLIAPIKKYRKIPNNFQKILVWKYKVCTVPKNTGIPGFCKNTVPYRTGIKFLIPLEPGHEGWNPSELGCGAAGAGGGHSSY